ncbi:MAG: hypothetical protein ACRDMV_00040 [Streptosporangiales bacterium]
MNTSLLPLALPRRTLRLFGRYWLPLIVFYLMGRGAHDLLAEAAAHVNRHIPVLAFSVLALAILCKLASYVLMFLCVHGGLPTVWSVHQEEGRLDERATIAGRRGLRDTVRTVSLTLMPFLIVYAAWNLFEDDVRDMSYRTWAINPIEASPSVADFTLWFAAAGIVAYLLRMVFERLTMATGNPVTGIVTAVFEANWMLFALYGITRLWGGTKVWFFDTVAWQNLSSLVPDLSSISSVIPLQFGRAFGALGDLGWLSGLGPALKDGIALPLAWLAIAGVAYSREMEDVRSLVFGHRRVAAAAERAPNVVKRWAKVPPSVREKYVPPLHTIRLMLAAGLPAFFLFCVFYSGVEVLSSVFEQGITTVIGPHNAGTFWGNVDLAIGVGVDAVFEPLRICLLAAAFDLALSRFSARNAGSTGTLRGTQESAAAQPLGSPAR